MLKNLKLAEVRISHPSTNLHHLFLLLPISSYAHSKKRTETIDNTRAATNNMSTPDRDESSGKRRVMGRDTDADENRDGRDEI